MQLFMTRFPRLIVSRCLTSLKQFDLLQGCPAVSMFGPVVLVAMCALSTALMLLSLVHCNLRVTI